MTTQNVLDTIAFEGPRIMFFVTLLSIWRETKFLLAFPVGFVANIFLNKFLKNVFREPRPPSLHNLGSLDNIHNYQGVEIYGMPSGHAQSIFFSLSYLYFVKKSNVVLMASLFLAMATLYQRWFYGRHSVEQLFIGSLVGLGFAYVWVWGIQHVQFPYFNKNIHMQ